MAAKRKMLVIIGPTASGKSEVALELASRHGGEILSIDSMQVYREMDIGTAKPTQGEQAAVRHHLIDVVYPNESFTVARFVALADAVIRGSACCLIATGGTPLYYKSLFEGLFEGPSADRELRSRLGAMSNEALHAWLERVDPAAGARIHVNDTKRVVRALEVQLLTGRPISWWQREWASPRARHEAVWFGLQWDREALNRRINARTKAMIAAGWVEEVRHLVRTYGRLSPTAAEATGYRELIEHIEGRCSLEEAVERIKIGTRQLARRQMKWFRRFANVQWLDGEQPLAAQVERITEEWRRSSET